MMFLAFIKTLIAVASLMPLARSFYLYGKLDGIDYAWILIILPVNAALWIIL